MTQFALMPPGLLPDMRAVGGLCFGGISALFSGGHRALLRFVSLVFFWFFFSVRLGSFCEVLVADVLGLRSRRVLFCLRGESCWVFIASISLQTSTGSASSIQFESPQQHALPV